MQLQIYKFGEKIKVEDLLYAMLIPSGNDAANVLAEHVSGSLSGFAELMNKKAKEIGCTNSNFTNPSGIHDENLYTTAYDLSLIARYAMNFETFRKVVSTPSYTLPSTNAYSKADRTFSISNSLINPNSKDYYEYATGIKTGYTSSAKDCLIASAKKDDIEFMIVVLGAGSRSNGQKERYLDCKTLFDFAFDNYTAYYKNLQEEKARKSKIMSANNLIDNENTSTYNNSDFLKTISKVIAIIAIILALKLIFGRRKRNKKRKKNRR